MGGKKNVKIGTEIKKMEKALKEQKKGKSKRPTPDDIFRQMTEGRKNDGEESDQKGESSENDFDEIPWKAKVMENLKKSKTENDESYTESDEPPTKEKKGKNKQKGKKGKKEISSEYESDDIISKKYKSSLGQFRSEDESEDASSNKKKSKKGQSSYDTTTIKGKHNVIHDTTQNDAKAGDVIKRASQKELQQQKELLLSQKESTEDLFQGNKIWKKDMFSSDDEKSKKKPKAYYGTAEDLFRKRMEARNSGELYQEEGMTDEDEYEDEYETDDEDERRIVVEDTTFTFVPKSDWGGEPPRFTKPLEHPIKIVRLTYTSTDKCFDMEVCAPMLKQLDDKARKVMNLPDIQWNFIIGCDGTIYEGRGWNVEGYKNKDCRRKYGSASVLELGYFGDYEHEAPPDEMRMAHNALINDAKKKGYVDKMHTCTTFFPQ